MFHITPTPTSDAEENHQLDVEYKWLMEDKAGPLKAVHFLWEHKYAGKTSNGNDDQNSIHDLLLLKRFAEGKLSELSELSEYIGDNNTVIVTDTGIKGEKK